MRHKFTSAPKVWDKKLNKILLHDERYSSPTARGYTVGAMTWHWVKTFFMEHRGVTGRPRFIDAWKSKLCIVGWLLRSEEEGVFIVIGAYDWTVLVMAVTHVPPHRWSFHLDRASVRVVNVVAFDKWEQVNVVGRYHSHMVIEEEA